MLLIATPADGRAAWTQRSRQWSHCARTVTRGQRDRRPEDFEARRRNPRPSPRLAGTRRSANACRAADKREATHTRTGLRRRPPAEETPR